MPGSLGVPWEPWLGPGKWGEGGCCWGAARLPSYRQESPLEESAEKAFYSSEEEDAKDAKAEAASLAKRNIMDPDHRLLLRNTKPLLQSRNAAVSPLPQPCPSPEATGGVHEPVGS